MKIFNGTPGFGRELSNDEIVEFLTTSKKNLQLGTIDEKNEPNIHPVWFLYQNGAIYCATEKKSKKYQNILKNNLVYFSVDEDNSEFKGVRGKGSVLIRDDINQNLPIAKKIMIKYTGSTDNEIAKFLLDGVRNGFSVILELTPKYYSTWDHSTGITA